MVSFKWTGDTSSNMLPEDTVSPEGEALFGRKLAIISTLWIVVTVIIGIVLVLLSPLLVNVF